MIIAHHSRHLWRLKHQHSPPKNYDTFPFVNCSRRVFWGRNPQPELNKKEIQIIICTPNMMVALCRYVCAQVPFDPNLRHQFLLPIDIAFFFLWAAKICFHPCAKVYAEIKAQRKHSIEWATHTKSAAINSIGFDLRAAFDWSARPFGPCPWSEERMMGRS